MFNRYRVARDRESDTALVRAACLGNGDAIAELYQRHGAIVYRLTLRMCGNASMAEEVTQEAFLAFLRHPHHFEAERSAFSTWLCGVARRQLWKRLERDERFVELNDVEEPVEAPSSDVPDHWFSRKETVEIVRKGIDELPLLLKEVVILCELEEMTYPEVAVILAVPIGTVRSRLHRAKARLAILLSAVPACAEKGIRP